MKNILRKKKKILFVFSLFSFLVASLFAQQQPPGTEPGAEATRFEQKTRAEKVLFEKDKVKKPAIDIEEEKTPLPGAPQIIFTLNDVKVTGATIFQERDFYPVYRNFLGRKVSYDELDMITEKIKSMYKEKGYLTTIVYIPEQEAREGIIEIRVVEGKMGDLNIEGNKWFKKPLLEKFFHIKKNEILDFKILQRDILRLNQNSDLEVKTVITAGKAPGTSDVILKVSDKFPWHIGLGSDNQGSRLVGKWRGSGYLRSSNVSGNFDSLFINSLVSTNSFGESLSYSCPLDTYGTKFNLDFTYFKMKLGKEFKVNDIRGTSKIFTPHFLFELILDEDTQLNADLGLDAKSIIKKMSGEVTSKDELRIPFFSFDFSKIDSFGNGGQTRFVPRFNFSTSGFLGASSRNHPSASRQGTGGFFFSYGQMLSRIQRMPLDTYLSIKTDFQAVSHTLPSSEQFQIGGANSVRGYPEGDYLADIGGVMNLEWVLPMYLIPKNIKLKGADIDLRHQITPVLFFDIGGGFLKETMPGEVKNKFLMGVGGGLRMYFNRNIYLKLDWAKHVGDDPTAGNGPSTFHLTFQSEI
ncbi:MAG: ShlB/FhaC/HecB family hemolysin secretion/activation protein [Candidatus Omnitrophota bacterium]